MILRKLPTKTSGIAEDELGIPTCLERTELGPALSEMEPPVTRLHGDGADGILLASGRYCSVHQVAIPLDKVLDLPVIADLSGPEQTHLDESIAGRGRGGACRRLVAPNGVEDQHAGRPHVIRGHGL